LNICVEFRKDDLVINVQGDFWAKKGKNPSIFKWLERLFVKFQTYEEEQDWCRVSVWRWWRP
jgi:hypothetical protein